MSGFGPGSIGGWQVAGSFAGTQRAGGETDRLKAESAQQKFQVDRQDMSAGPLAEAELSADRDADGHLAHDPHEEPPDERPQPEADSPPAPLRPEDAFGERGTVLDLDA